MKANWTLTGHCTADGAGNVIQGHVIRGVAEVSIREER